MKKVLAFDHGTTSGVSFFCDGEYHESFTVDIGNIENIDKAYKSFQDYFYLYKPDTVVVEKINVAGSKFGGNNVIKLAQLQAMILLLAKKHQCKVIEVNPTSMKKYITGNGRAEKHEVADVVAKRWNLNPKHICVPVYYKRKEGIKSYKADESDSIALGTYALEVNA